MAGFVTPSQLAARSDFYYQLSNLIGAGIPLITALETILKSSPARDYVQPIKSMVGEMNQGFTFTESLFNRKKWLPEFDLALLSAGENSGRLDETLRVLSEFYRDRAKLMKEVISKMMYPLMLLHISIFIFPIQGLQKLVLEGDIWAFVKMKAPYFIILYGGAAALIYLCSSSRGESWRSLLERQAQLIPVLGKALRNLAVARSALALEALISAGVSIITAWRMAGDASGSPAIRREVTKMIPRVEEGETPGEVLGGMRSFPDLFKSMYQTGEISGTLDKDMRRAYRLYSEEALRGLTAVADWTPKLAYLIIAIGVAMSIISFYQQYFGQMQQFLQ